MADKPLSWNRRNRGQRFRDYAVTHGAAPATSVPEALLEQQAVQGTSRVRKRLTPTLKGTAQTQPLQPAQVAAPQLELPPQVYNVTSSATFLNPQANAPTQVAYTAHAAAQDLSNATPQNSHAQAATPVASTAKASRTRATKVTPSLALTEQQAYATLPVVKPRGRGRPRKPAQVVNITDVQDPEQIPKGNYYVKPRFIQVGKEIYALQKRPRGRPRKDRTIEMLNVDPNLAQELAPAAAAQPAPAQTELSKNAKGNLSPLTIELLASRAQEPQKKRMKRSLSLTRTHQRRNNSDTDRQIARLIEQAKREQEIQDLIHNNPSLSALAGLNQDKSSAQPATSSDSVTAQPQVSAQPATSPAAPPKSRTKEESARVPRVEREFVNYDQPLLYDAQLERLRESNPLAYALEINQRKLRALEIPMHRGPRVEKRSCEPLIRDAVVYINKKPHRQKANLQYYPTTEEKTRTKRSKLPKHTRIEQQQPILIQLTQKEEQLTRPTVHANQVRGEITNLGIYQRSDKEQQHLEQLMDYYKQVYPTIPYHELHEYMGSANVTYRSLAVHVQHYKEHLAAQKQQQEANTWRNTQEYSRLLSLKVYHFCNQGKETQPTLDQLVALEQDPHYQECVQGITRLELANPRAANIEISKEELEQFVQLSPNPQVQPYDTRHLPLELVYQDEHIVVANKPYGMLSVPGFIEDSVETRVREMFGYAQAAHRLDMATSGLIIIAITPEADSAIKAQFREREMEKVYVAMVDNRPPYDHSFIDAPIACDWEVRPRQRVDYDLGRPCLTEYQVLSYDPQANVSIVQLIPHTGRTHQLRVHLESIGCPIVGDKFYNVNYLKKPYHRMCLHASYLAFNHPITNEYQQLTALRDFAHDLGVPDYCENPIVTRLYIDDDSTQLGFIHGDNIDSLCRADDIPDHQNISPVLRNPLLQSKRNLEPWQLKADWHYDLAHYLNMQVEPEVVSHTTLINRKRNLRQTLGITLEAEHFLHRAYPHAYSVVQKFYDRLPVPSLLYPAQQPPQLVRLQAKRKNASEDEE